MSALRLNMTFIMSDCRFTSKLAGIWVSSLELYTKENKDQIEMVQRRAARWVANDYL